MRGAVSDFDILESVVVGETDGLFRGEPDFIADGADAGFVDPRLRPGFWRTQGACRSGGRQ